MSKQNQQRVRHVCEQFRSLDMTAILNCFTETVEVQYNDLPLIQGRPALHDFLAPRYAQLQDYTLDKQVVLNDGDRVGVRVSAGYIDRGSGQRYQSTILEVLQFEGELISRWDYVGHTSAVGAHR